MALMTIAKLIKRASRRNDDLRFLAAERSFDRLMKPVSGHVPRHLSEGPSTPFLDVLPPAGRALLIGGGEDRQRE
jgi:hypothetical protein